MFKSQSENYVNFPDKAFKILRKIYLGIENGKQIKKKRFYKNTGK